MNLEQRIRERAHLIWVEEGRPHGRHDEHWDMARELVAIEDLQRTVTKKEGPDAEPIEAVESLGDLPGRTDQGERQDYPKRRSAAKGHSDVSDSADELTASKPAARRTRAKKA